MVLETTQILTEMSTSVISGRRVKAAGAWSQLYHLHAPVVMKSWSLNLLEPSRRVQACTGIG